MYLGRHLPWFLARSSRKTREQSDRIFNGILILNYETYATNDVTVFVIIYL